MRTGVVHNVYWLMLLDVLFDRWPQLFPSNRDVRLCLPSSDDDLATVETEEDNRTRIGSEDEPFSATMESVVRGIRH